MEVECIIIGGAPMDRVAYASSLRKTGVAVHTETHSAKKTSAFKRACALTRYGSGIVYDIDDPEDRSYLDRPDAFQEWRKHFDAKPDWVH